jgi:hypothetical protein
MQLPPGLPARLYLLAYDRKRQRPVTALRLGYALRAAALADLHLLGHLTDADGKPAAKGTRPTDPILAEVLAEIAGSPPRRWESWVRRNNTTAAKAVRDQLVAGGWIRVDPRRIRRDRVIVRDQLLVRRLSELVTRTLRQADSVSTVDRRDATLVALAAAAEASAVLGRRRRREHADRIKRLSAVAGPAVPALRKTISNSRAAMSIAGAAVPG